MQTALIIAALSSCDPGIKYNKIVQNDSDHDLKIYVYPDTSIGWSNLYKADTFLIIRHNQISIAEYSSLGEANEFEGCDTYADSFSIQVLDNDTLHVNLNLKENSNWTFSRIKKGFKDGGECECRVIISNDRIN